MPRYIVWLNTRSFYLCGTLVEAFEKKGLLPGSTVYEPLGMAAAERVHANQEDWEQFRDGLLGNDSEGVP